MRFSIIVPVYNVADYLPGCVDSILANDCSDCEVILVDDGATDGISPQMCDSYAEAHPALIRVIHQSNKGPGGARNTGLEAARGEYIFFVDSDDTIAPDSLRILSEAVNRTHADIYTFQMASHDGKGPKTPMEVAKPQAKPCTLAENPQLLLGLPAMWARIWRRDLFLNMGIRFPDKTYYGEDLRTTSKLLAVASSIVVLPDVLYFYLVRPGSIMQSANVARNRDVIRAFEDIVEWFRSNNLLQHYRKELCYLAVDHLLLAATVRVVLADPHSLVAREFLQYMRTAFPDYRQNAYVCRMSRSRKLALWLVEKRCYQLLRLLFRLKNGK